MIEVKVKKKLGEFFLDAELKDEKFISLLGKNGSGKTSLLNIIAGVYKPDEGYVKVNSEIINEVSPERKQIVLVTPDSYLPNFDVDRHLTWGANLRKKQISEKEVSEIKDRLGIGFQGRVSKLSLGMRERVSLATALIARPKLILIDEAFGNIDNRTEFIKVYRDLSQGNAIDVIFSTQLRDDSGCSDHLYEMKDGRATRVF